MDTKSLIPVPNVVRVNFHFTIGTNTNVHSHIYLDASTGDVTQATLDPTAAAIATLWSTNLKPWHHGTVSLTEVEVDDLGTPGNIPGSAVGPGAGSRSGDTPFADVAVLMNFKVAARYRGGKPRAYMPLLNAGDLQDNSHWNATILGNLQTAWRTFITGCEGLSGSTIGPAFHCSVRYIHAGAPLTTPVVDPVVQSTCNPIPGSQRRRLGR
jgi:hypothetical protein